MGVTTFTQEFTTSIAPNRMFKALMLDSHNLIPKLLPQSIKSIEYIQGDGGVGSIKQTNFHEGSHMKCLKHKIDSLDIENYACKYTLIEGDALGDKLEFLSYEVKFEAITDGGSKVTSTTYYHAKGDIELKVDELTAGKDKAMGMFKVVEDYLLANPDVYA
ncbi:major allergen Pru ar 1-like [Camellia sinensis]|uniref:Bet v I/Major latex protein domain-containing protein n=1 Tax=Camellia sinensis var. sinensis TaxID=542762 RepID=A0A4V3WKU0_CAMSN|nr:major allergen Pru ar 1-like [Camellia sinensis]THG02137.1 hypothetical protein TEA_020169 [Camellia sinensis var. sinensis]